MTFHELSYATARTPPVRRWLMRTIENLSGRGRLLKIYRRWRANMRRRAAHVARRARHDRDAA